MRTLQRLAHTRPPRPRQITHIRRAEDLTLQRRKKGIWRSRLKRLGVLSAVALVVLGVGAFLDRNVVLHGVVEHPNTITPLAPAQVRVTDVLVEPGATCRRGQVLVRLEAVDSSPRHALKAEIDERRTRLELARAGGELEGFDVGRRLDQAERSELERDAARAELAVALARLRELREEGDTLAAELDQSRALRTGEARTLREELRRAQAEADRALAETRRAELDATQKGVLEEDGIVSRWDAVAAEVDHTKAMYSVDETAARIEQVARELEVAEELATLEARRATEAREAMQAGLDVAAEEVEAARVRLELWTDLAAQRRALLPGDGVEGAELRALELRVLASQLRRAEARLAQLDRELGNLTVVAESDGVVDQVHVGRGSIVQAGAPLVGYYDPSEMRIVVYAPPGRVDDLRAGGPCHVYPAGGGAAIDARIHSVGLSWSALPGMLRDSADEPATTPHLPIRVECADAEELARLRPNMRLRMIVRREGRLASLLGWRASRR